MSKQTRIYIAGPMTGHWDHNFAAFHRAAERLRDAGWESVNPAEHFGGRTDLPRESYMRAAIGMLVTCDAVAMLPDWDLSMGARAEYMLATECGLTIIDAATLEPLECPPKAAVAFDDEPRARRAAEAQPDVPILEEAAKLVATTLHDECGHPSHSLARIAQLWHGLLETKLIPGRKITAMDVPLCLVAMKLVRQAHRPRRDNLVDIAGFAGAAATVMGLE